MYPGLALPGQRSALSDLASHARDPKVQGRLVAGGIPSLAVDALRCAIPEPAGPAAAECWHVQAQAARLLANLAYLQENKPAVFGAGAAEALESAARAALSVHDRDVAADRAVGPAGEGEAERVEAVACILVEAAAALANLASGHRSEPDAWSPVARCCRCCSGSAASAQTLGERRCGLSPTWPVCQLRRTGCVT